MPEYIFLLRDGSDMNLPPTDAEFQVYFQKFVDWAAKLEREGRLRGVERLKPAGEGQTVRKRADTIVTDGPYTEGKEAVLGFFIVDADDDAHAARIAAECPNVQVGGTVEVRGFDAFPKPRGR